MIGCSYFSLSLRKIERKRLHGTRFGFSHSHFVNITHKIRDKYIKNKLIVSIHFIKNYTN